MTLDLSIRIAVEALRGAQLLSQAPVLTAGGIRPAAVVVQIAIRRRGARERCMNVTAAATICIPV